jgi:hypothetical protein
VPGSARPGGRQARTQGGCNARNGIAPTEDDAWRPSGAAEASADLPEVALMLNPLRSEREAFRFLLYVALFVAVIIGIVFLLRAIL